MAPDGKRIRRLRETAAATDPLFPQTMLAFAEYVGVDPGYLSRIETGRSMSASAEWLRRVASGLGISVLAIASIDEEEVAS
jgi:transcriptional regulator with XRE-family HTH domain